VSISCFSINFHLSPSYFFLTFPVSFVPTAKIITLLFPSYFFRLTLYFLCFLIILVSFLSYLYNWHIVIVFFVTFIYYNFLSSVSLLLKPYRQCRQNRLFLRPTARHFNSIVSHFAAYIQLNENRFKTYTQFIVTLIKWLRKIYR